MNLFKKKFAVAFALCFLAGAAQSAPISQTEYGLTGLSNGWTLGRTDWNAADEFGHGGTALATAATVLQDGYSPLSPNQTGQYNGIYRWPTLGLENLTFSMNGGTDYVLDSLTFLSSRSYSSLTQIELQYRLDGGSWMSSVATSTGALGMSHSGAAEVYSLSFGNVQADQFRLLFGTGGDQVSLHEVNISGTLAQPSVVPLPAALPLLLAAMGTLGFAGRRRKST